MFALLKIWLAPVLIFQGKKVRKNTPRLPEAPGERSGVRGNGKKQIRLLILGDSAAAGVGIDHQENALSGQILKCFDNSYRIEWKLIAKTGNTTEMTLEYLKSIPPQSFDITVTSLGVNDLKSNVPAGKFIAAQKELVHLLQHKFNSRKILITSVPPMHLFPSLPWPLSWYLGAGSKRLNKCLAAWLKDMEDCDLLAFDLPMDPSLMAEDKFHPGPGLHTIWGEQVAQRIMLYFDDTIHNGCIID